MTTKTDKSGAPVEVRVTPENDAFGIYVDGASEPAGRTYFIDNGTDRIYYHTVVGDEFGGRGLAGILVESALEETRNQGLTVIPLCPYVRAWIPKHNWDGPVRTPESSDIAIVKGKA